jgi:hypothetical protein
MSIYSGLSILYFLPRVCSYLVRLWDMIFLLNYDLRGKSDAGFVQSCSSTHIYFVSVSYGKCLIHEMIKTVPGLYVITEEEIDRYACF